MLNDSADAQHDKTKAILQIAQKNAIQQDLTCSVQNLHARKCFKIQPRQNLEANHLLETG